MYTQHTSKHPLNTLDRRLLGALDRCLGRTKMVLKETKEMRVQQGREEWVEANKVCADIHHECWSSLELRRDTLRQNIARWVREIGEERGRIPMHLQVRLTEEGRRKKI